ncbi:MAG TPA: thioredoxin [Polyangiaceae bacterium]
MVVKCAGCGSQNRVPAERLTETPRCGSCKEPLSPTAEPYPVSSVAEFDELIGKSTVPVLVDFWAAWCGPCRTVAPELAKLARQRQGGVLVAKVNTEELPQVANRYSIQSIPTFVLFRGGKEASRTSGAMPAAQIERSVGL